MQALEHEVRQSLAMLKRFGIRHDANIEGRTSILLHNAKLFIRQGDYFRAQEAIAELVAGLG